jgi:AraC-like DNA-binding protein
MGETPSNMFERLDSRFDVLTQVLEAVRLDSALSARIELNAPWALHFGSTNRRAGFHIITRGRCWAKLDSADGHIALGTGDIVVFPHGAGHILGDHPDTPSIEVQEVVGDLSPGERVILPSQGSGEPTTILCGSYSFAPDGASPLLRGLPQLLHISADQLQHTPLDAAVRLLTAEAGGLAAGTSMVIDKLVDLLFVYALRTWISLRDDKLQSWFGALHDPAVGPAVRAVHAEPGYAWTVSALAQSAGLSRAAFARRFHQAVGESPLGYVTRWRMTVAADLLTQGRSIAQVAHTVGYENEFAFAKAFKRIRGIAPGQHRRRHAEFT